MDIKELQYGLWMLSSPWGHPIIEARAIKAGCPTHQMWIEGTTKVVEDWAAHCASKGYNLYLGRSPRRDINGSKDEDVDFTNCFTIDIDPVRADKTKPAANDEYLAARSAAHKATAMLDCGSILATGNGCQVWCKLDLTDLRGRRSWWKRGCDALEAYIASELGNYPVVVDKTQDIARLVKMPGSLSQKGIPDAEHPHREVRFITRDETKLDHEWIMDLADEDTEQHVVQTIKTVVVPQRFFDLLSKDKTLRDSFMAQRTDLSRTPTDSTSEQDLALVARLRRFGFSKEEAAAILRQAPYSKAKEREDYVRLTISKVFN